MADILDAHYEEQAEIKKDKDGSQKTKTAYFSNKKDAVTSQRLFLFEIHSAPGFFEEW
jgi:hypothetical protein